MSTPYVGEIRMFGFQRIPIGWLPCDGRLYAISQYEVLFMLLGTAYGGDGSTTFATPNLSGRVPVHASMSGSPRVIGTLGGSETVTLTTSQMPSHNHLMMATTTQATSEAVGIGQQLAAISGDTMYTTDTTGLNGLVMSAVSTTPTGGSQPHDNLMPTLTVQICIASAGASFRSRGRPMSDPFLGEIQIFGFNYPPIYWAFCNGAEMPIQQNSALYALLGTRYGGNGTTAFQLPNLAGRAACNQGNGSGLTPRAAGDTFGEIGVALTASGMPSHSHAVTVYNQQDQNKRAGAPSAGAALTAPATSIPFAANAQPNAQFAPNVIGNVGGSLPHENRQPFLALNFCIALRGEFPQFE